MPNVPTKLARNPSTDKADGGQTATCGGCMALLLRSLLTRPTLGAPRRALFPEAMASIVRRSVRTKYGTDQVAEPSSDRALWFTRRWSSSRPCALRSTL